MLERKIAGFKAAINVLVGELIGSGEKMTAAFEKPARSPFWTILLQTFGAGGIGAKMDMAAFAAESYTAKIQDMEDAERSLIVPRAESNLKIKEAMLLYNDANKPLSVRITSLKSAIDLENKTADIEIKMAHDQVENLKVINEEKKQARQFRDEDDLKLQNAMAKEIELQTESTGRQIRAAARIRTGTEQILKEQEDAAKKRTDAEQKVVDAYVKGMTTQIDANEKELKSKLDAIDKEDKEREDLRKQLLDGFNEELDAFNKTEDEKTKKAKEEADKRKEIEDELKAKKKEIRDIQIQMGQEIVDAAFAANQTKLDNELSSLEKEKEAKLKNTHLTAGQKANIEADYAKKEGAIKTKQAQNDKKKAIFDIAIETAKGAMRAVAEFPLTGGMPFLAWVVAMGVLQAGLVLAQPIPKYKHGTQSAERAGIFGEAGRELMTLRSGELMMADKPTYFEGSKFKGAKIYSNPETERMMSMVADRNIIVRNQMTDERILAGLEKLNQTILNKPVNILDSEHRVVGQRMSNHQEVYLNRLTNRN